MGLGWTDCETMTAMYLCSRNSKAKINPSGVSACGGETRSGDIERVTLRGYHCFTPCENPEHKLVDKVHGRLEAARGNWQARFTISLWPCIVPRGASGIARINTNVMFRGDSPFSCLYLHRDRNAMRLLIAQDIHGWRSTPRAVIVLATCHSGLINTTVPFALKGFSKTSQNECHFHLSQVGKGSGVVSDWALK